MYIGKDIFFDQRGFKPTGVIHVGINEGQEIPWYLHAGRLPMIGFEPVPDVYRTACETFSNELRPNRVQLINKALGAKAKTITLRIPLNLDGRTYDTQGASAYPQIPEAVKSIGWTPGAPVKTIEVDVVRFDDWAREQHVNLASFNLLVVDVQGMELEVLQGFGDVLTNFRFLIVESSLSPLYEGEATAIEISNFLSAQGFERISPIVAHDDVFYIRNA